MSGYSSFDDSKKTPSNDIAFGEYKTETNPFVLANSSVNLLNDNDNSHDISYSDFGRNDSSAELNIHDLSTSENHTTVPLEHDIVPLHASLSLPIEHVKHPPKLWRPLTVIVTDLIFGMLFITASLAGTIFEFRPVQLLDLHHDIFLIFGIYGIFIFGFSIVAAIAYRGQVKSLLLIFIMWKYVSLIVDVIVTLIIVTLIYTGVMGTFDYCAKSHRCIVTTSLVVTAIGCIYFLINLIGIYFMKLYLRERYGGHLLDDRRNSADGIARHSFLDDIESSFIEMPEIGYGNIQSPQRVAVLRFNRKPEAGIDYMINNGIIGSSPSDIARYLITTENLNLTKIGEYISENKPTNLEVLQELTNQFEFKNMEFDEAIRLFLSKFRLPGEAQKIDRIMESFAKRYCFCNPQGIFPHPDTAYILAFAVIMLNTDAHNPAIKKKMSKKEFIQNNKGIANGKDLPTEYLESLYDKIVLNEIKLNSEELFVKVVKKGWLKKMGRNNRWQRHWFVVANNCLYYFTSPADKDPKVIIPLEGLSIRENMDYKNKYCFELVDPNNHKIKSCKLGPQGPTEGQHDRFLMEVERLDDYESWLSSIKKNIVLSPVTQLLNMKKQKLLQKQKL